MGQNRLNLRCWFHFSSFIGKAKVIFKFKSIWHDYTSYCLKNLKRCKILTWVKGELRLGQGNQQTLPFFLGILRIYQKRLNKKIVIEGYSCEKQSTVCWSMNGEHQFYHL